MQEVRKPRRTISRKLGRLVVITVALTVAVSGALHVWHVADTYLRGKRDLLLSTAQVFAAATSRAVATGDGAAAIDRLRAIAKIPSLVRAEIRGRDGRILAELGTAVRLRSDLDLDLGAPVSPLQLLGTRTIAVTIPVVDGGQEVGTLTLTGDASDVVGEIRSILAWAGIGSLGVLGVGLLLAYRLQKSIVQPISSLAAAMESVERTHDYGPVPAIESDDETGLLASRFNSMIGQIRQATDSILAREEEIIGRLSRAGEQRDDQTGQHVVRVARISRIIGEQLGLAPAYLTDLCKASPMHDVGKISIPDAILFKPGALTPEERREMQALAMAGYEVLSGSSSSLVQLAAEIALTHHERWDGGGYPRGLKGEEIPISGRITAVADVCDALLSTRPYKKAWSFEAVREHLRQEAGGHFDPACAGALLARWDELRSLYGAEQEARKAA